MNDTAQARGGRSVPPLPGDGGEPAAAVLSLDIGGTKLAVGVVTPDGAVHGLIVEPTRRWEGPDAVIRRLFDVGHRAVAAAGLDRPIDAVGISCGGPLDSSTGVLISPPHLPGWIDVPLGELTRQEFGVPAYLENDATAAALGEHRFGAARGVSTMIYLTISTGVGGGAVIDGRLHRGAAGNGGELGHLMVRPGGRLCSCGRRGCLEAYVSGTNIAERAAEGLRAGAASSLRDADPLTAADVAAAARAGDAFAREIWAETTDVLGQALTDLVNVFEPELVVLGGGVTRAGAMLLDPVAEAVARDAMPPAAKAARVVLAGLGDVVCVVGAGVVALDALEVPSSRRSARSADR
ncbi:ROK family protein [Jiangella rhizosphaerae]|uniref:ROK family protein n=1 Tax=Jiangella rhizosphaerae TaxID=2293569 RepID=A0A418KLS6_9ACTN|nr:ROK family protein [Jiangella rhizosphaerae]RIQ18874.1 ROK family protein [Jiangella rhizosphaerae]